MVLFLENEIIFEKIVNLSKNFQKLFLQTADAQRAWNLLFEMRNLGSEVMENCPWLKKGVDGWQRKVAPCLDDAAAVRKQSSLVIITTELPRTQRRRRRL